MYHWCQSVLGLLVSKRPLVYGCTVCLRCHVLQTLAHCPPIMFLCRTMFAIIYVQHQVHWCQLVPGLLVSQWTSFSVCYVCLRCHVLQTRATCPPIIFIHAIVPGTIPIPSISHTWSQLVLGLLASLILSRPPITLSLWCHVPKTSGNSLICVKVISSVKFTIILSTSSIYIILTTRTDHPVLCCAITYIHV